MTKVKTKPTYANQDLQLPIVGIVSLDADASFDCPEDKLAAFVKAMAGSLTFEVVKEAGDESTENTLTEGTSAPVTGVDPTPEKIDDPEALKEAIEDASIEELLDLASLVPGVDKTKKELKKLDQISLKNLLLSKIQ